jgi:hypothetical protein
MVLEWCWTDYGVSSACQEFVILQSNGSLSNTKRRFRCVIPNSAIAVLRKCEGVMLGVCCSYNSRATIKMLQRNGYSVTEKGSQSYRIVISITYSVCLLI